MAYSTTVRRSGDTRIDGVLSGTAWASTRITWSAPDSASDYGSGYVSDADGDGRSAQYDGFDRLNAAQLRTARFALEGGGKAAVGFSIEGFTRLTIDSAGVGSGAGDIRIAESTDLATSYAYLPGGGMGGDVWFGGSGRSPKAGNYDHLTVIHEIGHALGLKHSHETWGLGKTPSAWDSLEFTVMTYRPYQGGAPTGYRFETWSAPQTYMMLDIAALQEMYGADYTTNADNTVYKWTPGSGRTYVNGAVAIDPGGNRIFATVWDGGGRDTYDLSAYKVGVEIDLQPGHHSVFSKAQLADLRGGPNDGHARGNIFNALLHDGDARSLIENAIGGSGNDSLIGNQARNTLVGGEGSDRLLGCGGDDRLEGGPGADRLVGGHGSDTLIGGSGADTFVFRCVETSTFGDGDHIMPARGVAFDAPGKAYGDRIDLSSIDADAVTAGGQSFVFGGKGRGHVWLAEKGTVTMVYADIDNDGTPELAISIHDGAVRSSAYSAHDFIL